MFFIVSKILGLSIYVSIEDTEDMNRETFHDTLDQVFIAVQNKNHITIKN